MSQAILRNTIFALALISTPANARELTLKTITPSGLPEAIFDATSAADVQGLIQNACLDLGWRLKSSVPVLVECQGSGYVNPLFMPRYATAPVDNISFSILPDQGGFRVKVSNYGEYQTAFGQTRIVDGTSAEAAQIALLKAGGKLPSGTRFDGYDLGIEGIMSSVWGMEVTKITPGSAAEASSLQVGDVISKVNNHSFDDDWWFYRKVNKEDGTHLITFTVRRDKQKLLINVELRRRPPVP